MLVVRQRARSGSGGPEAAAGRDDRTLRARPNRLAGPHAVHRRGHPWWTLLDEWRTGVRYPASPRSSALFYDDPGFRTRFEECPASLSGHHAELGGLLMHTCEVAAIGRTNRRRVRGKCGPGARGHSASRHRQSRELPVGGLLRDDDGRLPASGTVVLGALMLDRRLEQEAARRVQRKSAPILHHLILSHHGKLEFGAPVSPDDPRGRSHPLCRQRQCQDAEPWRMP